MFKAPPPITIPGISSKSRNLSYLRVPVAASLEPASTSIASSRTLGRRHAWWSPNEAQHVQASTDVMSHPSIPSPDEAAPSSAGFEGACRESERKSRRD